MKDILRRSTAALLIPVALFTGCKQDFLDTQPLDKAPGALVWSDAALAESAVTELYNGLGPGVLDQQNMDTQTDNALYNFGKQDITEANISPSNTGRIYNDWGGMYGMIRAANLALLNLGNPRFPNNGGIVERLQGESYFMRAYFYHQLMRNYGGVPLVKSPYQLGAADFTIARSTFAETVDFIVSDLDSAALLLQGKTLAFGRATQEAALALKSRVLLYAASDLHDIAVASGKSNAIGGFANKELLGYTSGSQTERWQKAQAAAKAVMDLGRFGYKLDLGAPVTAEEGQANYTNMALARAGGEREHIFARTFINEKDEWGAWYPRNNQPNGYHGWTSSQPT